MSVLWSYFWPALADGLVLGTLAGTIFFRRRTRRVLALILGPLAAIGLAALWHGPMGAGERLAGIIDRNAKATLVYYELPQISAEVHRGPLSRRVILSGRPDDFQRTELPRTMDTLPGVASTRWAPAGSGIPLIVEAALAALLGFLLGWGLAYLGELHRRHNAQWNW